jgi:hypothetical protein
MKMIKKNDSQAMWSDLSEDQSESINGGSRASKFGININVNPVIQGNVAVVLARKVFVDQGNIYRAA